MDTTGTYIIVGVIVFMTLLFFLVFRFAGKQFDRYQDELNSLQKECDDFKVLLLTVRSKAELKILVETTWKELVDKIGASQCSRHLEHRVLNILGRMNGMVDVYNQFENPTENIKTS